MTARSFVPLAPARVMVSPAWTPSFEASAEPTTASSASSEGHAPSSLHHERMVVTPAVTLSPVDSARSLLNQVPRTRTGPPSAEPEETSRCAVSEGAKSTML